MYNCKLMGLLFNFHAEEAALSGWNLTLLGRAWLNISRWKFSWPALFCFVRRKWNRPQGNCPLMLCGIGSASCNQFLLLHWKDWKLKRSNSGAGGAIGEPLSCLLPAVHSAAIELHISLFSQEKNWTREGDAAPSALPPPFLIGPCKAAQSLHCTF